MDLREKFGSVRYWKIRSNIHTILVATVMLLYLAAGLLVLSFLVPETVVKLLVVVSLLFAYRQWRFERKCLRSLIDSFISGQKKADFENNQRVMQKIFGSSLSIHAENFLFYVADDPNGNATVIDPIGRIKEKPLIVLSQPFLNDCGNENLLPVVAHEMGHVVNRDALRSAILSALISVLPFIVYIAATMFVFSVIVNLGTLGNSTAGNFLFYAVVTTGAVLCAYLYPEITMGFKLHLERLRLSTARTAEYAADAFSASLTSPSRVESLLLWCSLSRQVFMDPYTSVGTGISTKDSSHPTNIQRIKEIGRYVD